MATHEEMIRAHAENYHLMESKGFKSKQKYVLHLIHTLPYRQAARLAANKTVLDFGCNTGFGCQLLAESANSVIGVDVSEAAIAAAKTRYGHLPVDFRVFDGNTLPFADDAFDMIVSFQVIEHVVDYEIYVNEIKRVLAPEGFALFTTPNALIRLDPGMKPWNKFHVREFNFYELQTLLRTFFSAVQTAGLFANEPLYSHEFRRVNRAREIARKQAKSGIIPTPPISRRAAEKPISTVSPELENFINSYGIEDVFYRLEELSIALDLIAVCSDNESIVKDLTAKICKA